ncbi:GGDEF domain-containing protein [Marinospirillum sp.]|uniref:GGDEF domain-containing protein n=1 Tax=Marinospirillum sp. TaxID=2183934 RepID=UPI003A8A903B
MPLKNLLNKVIEDWQAMQSTGAVTPSLTEQLQIELSAFEKANPQKQLITMHQLYSELLNAYSHLHHQVQALTQANQHLSRQLNMDPLTGLHNRKHFLHQLGQQLEHGSTQPRCLIFIDLDDFKNINDHYGHLAGDQALQLFASLLEAMLPDSEENAIARLGGEEFIAYLSPCNAWQAAEWCADLQQQLAQAPLLYQQKEAIQLTFSAGIAMLQQHLPIQETGRQEQQALAWLHCADQAMYRAKNQGKNQFYLTHFVTSPNLPTT